MRFGLRTLMIVLALAPLAGALTYWACDFAFGGPLRMQVYSAFLIGFFGVSIYSCIAICRGVDCLLFGPSAIDSWRRYWRRKPRHRLRVRIERYAAGST